MDVEHKLSDVLSEFARTLATDFPIQAILDHLVGRIVDVLPITGAGVTLISPGSKPQYVAASDESALRFEQLQTEVGEGPCLVAYHTGEAVAIAELAVDEQFAKFAPRALEAGLKAVFTFPLHHGSERLGALDLYRDSPGSLDAEEMAAAQTLADVATAYLLNGRARVDMQEYSELAHQMSLHDALTGLPNRVLLMERLGHAIQRCWRTNNTVAVLFADLDGFKAVNDTYGHHVGDELLIAVANRLTGLLRPTDTLARLSGDEFVVVCEDLADTDVAGSLAERIQEAFTKSFVLPSAEVQISASVGIACAVGGDAVAEQVLRDADSAMYQAKRRGGAGHHVVDIDAHHLANHRAALNNDLRGAIDRDELNIVYQPIVATIDQHVTGVEALLRWDHPVRGPVPASTLIPIAEQAGLITTIGRWVLEQSCIDRQRWHRAGATTEQIALAVNVSAQQLMSPGFAETVTTVLDDTGTDPGLVTLDVTESVFVQDPKRALLVLDELKRLGVALALDDFGTGYSSLRYLMDFPFDIIKIDRSFITGLRSRPASRLIVASAVRLAHDLGMTVIAEGVETSDQHEYLTSLGCEACQGFYYARPAPANELDAGRCGICTEPSEDSPVVPKSTRGEGDGFLYGAGIGF